MSNTEHLGFNYRGKAWADGKQLPQVQLPDGTVAEAVAGCAYVWNGTSFVKSPTTVKTGKTSVTTSGTRVVLASTTGMIALTIKARSTNTGIIYVGDVTVAAATGFQLSAGDSVSFDFADPSTIYLDASVNGEGVTYLGIA